MARRKILRVVVIIPLQTLMRISQDWPLMFKQAFFSESQDPNSSRQSEPSSLNQWRIKDAAASRHHTLGWRDVRGHIFYAVLYPSAMSDDGTTSARE
jgi:hypothetical protein